MKKPLSLSLAHMLAFFTVMIWGATFIASKYMLAAYTPSQIILLRFGIGYVFLWLLYPRTQKVPFKDEFCFLCMGLFGNSLYFFLENTALLYTLTANVSIILSAAPLCTAILAHFFTQDEKMRRQTIYGSLIAFAGVAMVIFNGTVILKLNPRGDILAATAAVSWAIYSIILRRQTLKYDGMFLARRVALWGIITILPVIWQENIPFPLSPLFHDSSIFFSWIFLGFLGSALCYILWNAAVFRLGAVTANNYIFLSPFITMMCAAFFLHEPIHTMGILGAIMIICGIVLANRQKS